MELKVQGPPLGVSKNPIFLSLSWYSAKLPATPKAAVGIALHPVPNFPQSQQAWSGPEIGLSGGGNGSEVVK